jgi:tRNA-dependent cyclodipeptide synthase
MNDLSNDFSKMVKVKRACAWNTFDVARLQISVGQSYHEGADLEATVKWAKNNFKKVIVCVNDTLQRHNFEFAGDVPDVARTKAEAAGREWIEENYKILSTLPNVEIIRWDQWDNSNTRKMESLYETIPLFKKTIDDEIKNFWNRRSSKQRHNTTEWVSFNDHSKRYLLEECAVFAKMFERDRAADIYPGSTLIPCNLLKGMGQYGFTRIEFKHSARPNVA